MTSRIVFNSDGTTHDLLLATNDAKVWRLHVDNGEVVYFESRQGNDPIDLITDAIAAYRAQESDSTIERREK